MKSMNLEYIIANINNLDDEGTIFVSRVSGEYRANSPAVIIKLSDEEVLMPIKNIAEVKVPGKSYFLEIFIVKEILEGWESNHGGRKPTLEQALESIVYYSENDAYPESFFS